MEQNLTFKYEGQLKGEIDSATSGALPLFWAVAAVLTGGDIIIKNARSDTEPLNFLTKFQKLNIPFEVHENDLHIWFEEWEDKRKVEMENSFNLILVPLFLKLPFETVVSNIHSDLSEQLKLFIKEAKRLGANMKLEGSTLTVLPSKIRAGRLSFTQNENFNQALLLLSLLSKGKSTLLQADPQKDWIKKFIF